MTAGSKPHSTVFFDGVCNLCNGFVDYLIRRDSAGVLKYAPLQGSTAKAKLPRAQSEDLLSMAFISADGKLYTESSAALKSIAALGGVYSLASLFFVIPKFLRDFVYRIVASHRYQWFGQKDTCRLPSPEERSRFLD